MDIGNLRKELGGAGFMAHLGRIRSLNGAAGFVGVVLQLHSTHAMTATVQARIDEQIRDEASAVLERWGLSVSDAVSILLTRTAREGRLPIELLSTSPEHDQWFRGQVSLALNHEQEISNDMVEQEFAHRRETARAAGDRHNAGKRDTYP